MAGINGTPPLSVLIVDDELSIRKALSAVLESEGHAVTAVSTAADALREATRRSFDLAFIDLALGADKGIDLIPALLAESPWMRCVVITAYASIDTAVESIKRGATDYLPKPFTPGQVNVITRKVAELRELQQRVNELQGEGGSDAKPQADVGADLVSASPAMQRALTLAQQVAQTDSTVLLRGESGTGKGVLAKAIHRWSPRGLAGKPFSVVSCPSLSGELLASELFGHVRGAFTGAVNDNPGRIAATEGGTLMLDEIGDLPLMLQPKLLRFVQDREYERVGHHLTRRADVRVIAATNIDLDQAVREGRFRQDLLYRINVIQIVLPPLRERREDIPALAERILAYYTRRTGANAAGSDAPRAIGFTPAALDAMRGYAWPGNVRELRNVVERAAILCRSELVGPEHLALEPGPSRGLPGIGDRLSLEQLEELHIRAVLASTPSLEEAANVLGVDTVTLWRRRKKYGV